jgi:hypothetical protein
MATAAEQAIREISNALKELGKVSSSRVTRDGDHFSFALPERPATAASATPQTKDKKTI